MAKKDKGIKSFIKRHIIVIIAVFMFANSSIFFLIFSKAQNSNCMYQSQIDADSRCLYVYHNEVYEKGTRNSPHQGNKCGINVDNNIPSLHFSGSIASRFNDAKVGTFCAGSPPTEAPVVTQAPTQAPTEAPVVTQAPSTATNSPAVQKTATPAPKKTQASSPVVATPSAVATSVATITPIPAPTSVSYSGNSFGEILGRPETKKEPVAINTITPIKTDKETQGKKFDPTMITKPVTYATVASFIGSIILILIF